MLSRALLLFVPLALVPALPAAEPVANPDKLKAIPAAMQQFVEAGELSGAVTVVGRKDGVVAFDAVGQRDIAGNKPMAKDTLFRIASMTKPVTAIGIMILADARPTTTWRSTCPSLPTRNCSLRASTTRRCASRSAR